MFDDMFVFINMFVFGNMFVFDNMFGSDNKFLYRYPNEPPCMDPRRGKRPITSS